jgi:putative transposase
MLYDPQKHHRHSIRLKGYDYTQTGAYFVTICAWGRKCLFGEVAAGEMVLNENGLIVLAAWEDLSNHYSNVELDAFVVMPNHVHGIIVLRDGISAVVGAGYVSGYVGAGLKPAPTTNITPNPATDRTSNPATNGTSHPATDRTSNPVTSFPPDPTTDPKSASTNNHGLPEIVRALKTFSARRINEFHQSPGVPVWQRNYFDHIIRNEDDWRRIYDYIQNNPVRWEQDQLHPAAPLNRFNH